jgi:hypothetical protein
MLKVIIYMVSSVRAGQSILNGQVSENIYLQMYHEEVPSCDICLKIAK